MQIKATEKMLNLKGKPITVKDEIEETEHDLTYGEAMANILLAAQEGGKMKMFILAEKLYKDKTVEVDEADLNLIKSATEGTKVYNNLFTGQILLKIEALKDEKKEAKKK